MKKKLAALSIIGGLIANGVIYPATGLVIETTDTATIETANGHCYLIDAEDNEEGDILACIMYNSGTPADVTDDIILTYRYTGTIEQFNNMRRETA